MKRLILILSILIISSYSVSARTIKGEVRSENDSTPLPGAVCRLLHDSALITAVATGNDGEFEIASDNRAILTLEISMTGFAPSQIIIESGKNVNVGTIFLSEVVTLDEVQVTANSMVDANGRTIVFPSESDLKASSSAISLFQKLPLAGLETNPVNRSVSVDGGSPMILINGVPASLDDFNALNPKDISKVEFSRLTPPKIC